MLTPTLLHKVAGNLQEPWTENSTVCMLGDAFAKHHRREKAHQKMVMETATNSSAWKNLQKEYKNIVLSKQHIIGNDAPVDEENEEKWSFP